MFLTGVVLWLLPICDSHLFLHTPCPFCLGALWLPGELLYILPGALITLACLSTPLPGSPWSASIALCLSLLQWRPPPPLSPHLPILFLCSPPEQGLLLSSPAPPSANGSLRFPAEPCSFSTHSLLHRFLILVRPRHGLNEAGLNSSLVQRVF